MSLIQLPLLPPQGKCASGAVLALPAMNGLLSAEIKGEHCLWQLAVEH